MAALLTSTSEIVTQVITWVGDFATAISGAPLLMLFCVGIPVAGLGVGFLNRLIRVG